MLDSVPATQLEPESSHRLCRGCWKELRSQAVPCSVPSLSLLPRPLHQGVRCAPALTSGSPGRPARVGAVCVDPSVGWSGGSRGLSPLSPGSALCRARPGVRPQRRTGSKGRDPGVSVDGNPPVRGNASSVGLSSPQAAA
jgi:hypothetical protein